MTVAIATCLECSQSLCILIVGVSLLSAEGSWSSEKVCAYQDVLDYLNLTKTNELFFMTRPVKDYKQPTQVCLEVQLYAILDVREIDQTFIPYVWIVASWYNQHIWWNPEDFCGIETVSIPTDVLWKPDICIDEMTEKDKAPPSPHLTIYSNGLVNVQNDQVLVSTCRMHVYKFPFDIQRCNLSFKSVVHSVNEIQLVHQLSSTEDTHATMRTQYEWLFISMTVTNKTVVMFNIEQDVLVYTISMKRRSVLYIVNFLLPLLIFLCLDLASFLISDTGGEKLSFKVTVTLAVTVMQLILNEILPASSDRIPLIVVYCIGIFGLMMLSLLETILVMYLIGKDSEDKETDGDRRRREEKRNDSSHQDGHNGEDKRWTAYLCDVSADQAPSGPLKGSSSLSMEERCVSEKLSDELREVVKALALLINSKKEDRRPGYWTRKSKTINRAFFIFHVMSTTLFLVCMFTIWSDPQE
ncbi:5-hydroxytryptamine receptor 3A-like [Antennarius striatus]|uniref:5-hydroxytryptamine receptor 3A-like n=1 Tax=Antennarius striatus TaxID=241820 RepID=UPI0035B4E928